MFTIQLPPHFTHNQHLLIVKYLVHGRHTLSVAEWQVVLLGFDELHQALLVKPDETVTFKQIYEKYVELPFANLYLTELLNLPKVAQQYPTLRARLARVIVAHLRDSGLQPVEIPATNLLLAYCLYFWEAFTSGYAFEVEIYRDLTMSGVEFIAHDIRNRVERSSAYDLQVLGFQGDIKSSTYFLHVRRSEQLAHDFYITRFYQGKERRTLVVMLQPEVWKKIDGDTLTALLEEAVHQFPKPVLVEVKSGAIIVVDYQVWKEKIKLQQEAKTTHE